MNITKRQTLEEHSKYYQSNENEKSRFFISTAISQVHPPKRIRACPIKNLAGRNDPENVLPLTYITLRFVQAKLNPILSTLRRNVEATLGVRMPATFGKGIEGSTLSLLPRCVNGIQAARCARRVRYGLYLGVH